MQRAAAFVLVFAGLTALALASPSYVTIDSGVVMGVSDETVGARFVVPPP